MAIMGHGVSFGHKACELSMDYLVEVFCDLNSRERVSEAGDVLTV